MELFDKGYDKVVKSIFCSGKTSYEYAVKNFLPQIDKYYAQRKKVDEKFYQKLERDIVLGCVMPAITIALVLPSVAEYVGKSKEEIITLLEEQKENLYILDGIQRLNTLKRAYKDEIKDFDIYINLLVSDSDDRLLYRMITLNNGQKPMSARHQIEVLAHNIFDFENLPIAIQTEKARSKKRIKGSFDKDDIIKGYISYLSESVNIDNQKIIESKMDELIADKIIESSVTQTESQFTKVIEKIEEFIDEEYSLKWFKQPNNLIGFCAGIGKSYNTIKVETKESFKEMLEKFELSFESFDISKIKLGHLRRLTVQYFISKYDVMKPYSQPEIEDSISQASMLFM
ncbi:MAG TPA: hypothetical protein PLP23_13985 [Panacibacter sp.]|nr:hypothetical protein [Panacibacter sp.]